MTKQGASKPVKNSKQKILIVEDEQLLNDAYKIVLEKEGYRAISAFEGKEALELADKHKPDLILLDLRMPVMSGLEFLENFKVTERTHKPKILVFSNMDIQNDIDQAYALGATKYILKAWASPKELIRIVHDLLK